MLRRYAPRVSVVQKRHYLGLLASRELARLRKRELLLDILLLAIVKV